MAKQNIKRVLLKQNNKYHYLLNIEHRMSDGSLYITVPRNGRNADISYIDDLSGKPVYDEIHNESPNTKAISYHTSGRINYKNLNGGVIYAEPLFDITRAYCFFHFSIPNVSSLDEFHDPIGTNEFVIEVPSEANINQEFGLVISPLSYNGGLLAGIGITYEGLFNLIIAINPIRSVSPSNSSSFVYFMRPKGLYEAQKYSTDHSKLLFHQKLANEQNVIIYNPNNEGVYKMYFVVPMERTPNIKITFEDPGLEAVYINDMHMTNTTVHFKVKGKQGFIKNPKKISYVELDAS